MARINLVRDTEQQGARAREKRVFTSGRVVAVDPLTQVCRVDVGVSGTYMEDVPYTQQTPPNVGDVVSILYTPSGAPYIGAAKLSSGNTTVNLVGGVTSIRKSGATKLQGDVTLSQGSRVTLTQTGQDISIAASGLAIGDSIGSGTAGRILFEGSGPVLADSANLTWDNTTRLVTIKAADFSSGSPGLLVWEDANTSDYNRSRAGISVKRKLSITPGNTFGTGIGFVVETPTAGQFQAGAITADHEGTSDDDFYALRFRTSWSGDRDPVVVISSRGDLSFISKLTSGGFGLRLNNVTSASVTSPLAGALIYDTGVAKLHNGSTWKTLATTDQITANPTGAIIMYGAAAAPTGYLLCDGAAVSRATYSDLFAVIGTTFGAGDGSTTFNVPDLRQRFPLGKAASGTGSTLGGSGGNIDHVHAVDPPNTTSGGPSATVEGLTGGGLSAAASDAHTHDVNIASFNSGSANPPFLALNFIIKT